MVRPAAGAETSPREIHEPDTRPDGNTDRSHTASAATRNAGTGTGHDDSSETDGVRIWDVPVDDRHRDIHVYAPRNGDAYYKIGWTEGRKWRVASGGKTYNTANAKAMEIRERILADATPSVQPIRALVEAWLDEDRPRRRPWSPKYSDGCRYVLDRYVVPTIGDVRCADLSSSVVQEAISAAPTEGEGNRTKRVFRTALRWGYRHGWVTRDPVQLIGDVFWGTGTGTAEASTHGQPSERVDAADIVPDEMVEALAWAMLQIPTGRPQDALAIFVATYSGLRLGELLALQVGDCDVANGRIHVQRQVVETKGGCRVTLPKWSKKRFTILPGETPGGYLLAEGVAERIDAIRRAKGRDNVDGENLFSPARAEMWVPSRWAERKMRPASRLAGWPSHPEQRGSRIVEAQQWTMHSLRHRFAAWLLWDLNQSPADVAMAMGHQDVQVTLRTYASNPHGSLDRLGAATRRAGSV